jgi:hypothetical protein
VAAIHPRWRTEDNLDDDTEGVFVENMGAFSLRSTNNSLPPYAYDKSSVSKHDSDETGQGGLVHSPVKVTRTASVSSGFAAGLSSDHRRDIKAMIREWIEGHGSKNIPSQMADLARRAHVDINQFSSPHKDGASETRLSCPQPPRPRKEPGRAFSWVFGSF